MSDEFSFELINADYFLIDLNDLPNSINSFR